jgi:hypothetical protein
MERYRTGKTLKDGDWRRTRTGTSNWSKSGAQNSIKETKALVREIPRRNDNRKAWAWLTKNSNVK